MLREQFGLRNGITPEPTWEKKALATFVRTHGHNDRDAVILDEGSWDELIDNVAKIELDPHFAFGSISLNLKVHRAWKSNFGITANAKLSDVGYYRRTPSSSGSISDLAWVVTNHIVGTLGQICKDLIVMWHTIQDVV